MNQPIPRASQWSMIAVLFLLAVPTFAGAEVGRPVGPDGGPTEVRIEGVLLDVDEISGADQNFIANFYYSAAWMDERLAHDGPGDLAFTLGEVWHPDLQLVNQQKVFPSFPEIVKIAPDGEVTYRQRVWGPFSQPMELQEFPFDRQSFEIRMVASGWTPEEVRFVQNQERDSGLSPNFSQPDWEVLGGNLDLTPYRTFEGNEPDASFAIVFDAERRKGFYIWKIIFPLVLIVAMSWIVFWIDPDQSGTQIGVSMTSMLTLIAYRFMVGNLLPDLSYLTRLDEFILGSTVLVFASLVQAVATVNLARAGKHQVAQRMDLWCRILFPALFVGIIVWSFVL